MFWKPLMVAAAITMSVGSPALATTPQPEDTSTALSTVLGWEIIDFWQEDKAWDKCVAKRDQLLRQGYRVKCEYEAPKVYLYLWR